MNIASTLKLNNEKKIPLLGFGTYLLKSGREASQAIEAALKMGYRHIDTAAVYGNEEDVGNEVKESGIPRNELFITTKVWNSDQGFESTLKAFDKSLAKLRMDYVNLYLIHWPVAEKRNETWRALEQIYNEGKTKAIGVSNYTVDHLRELIAFAEVKPAVNQVEMSPFLYQKELIKFCKKHDIVIEAYSPLTRSKKLDDDNLKEIASNYNKTTAQLLLRWAIQHNMVILPKSAHRERIEENADIFDFEINSEDMKKLNALNSNYRIAWDPSKVD